MPNYNYQVPSAKYRRRLPYVMTAHEQQSDVRARRKSVCPKFEVEVELELELEMGMEMEMEMGHSWNKRGYRLQHQDKRKKTPRAERPVCSVSKNYPKQTIPPKKTVNSKVLPNPQKTTHRKENSHDHGHSSLITKPPTLHPSSNPFQKRPTSTIPHSSQTTSKSSKQGVLFLLQTTRVELLTQSSNIQYKI